MKNPTALLPLVALAACHSGAQNASANGSDVAVAGTASGPLPGNSAGGLSPSQVAQKVAAANGGGDMVTPGRWEGTMTIHDMKMPKLPAEQQAQLAARMGSAKPFVSCVTPEQVKARHGFFTGQESADKSCKYDHFTMSGGKIDAAMACDHDGTKMTATMKGTYSPDKYHMDMASNTDSASEYAAMSMTMTIDGKRVGACTGTENKE